MPLANQLFANTFDGEGYPTFDPWPNFTLPTGNPSLASQPVVDGHGNGIASRHHAVRWRLKEIPEVGYSYTDELPVSIRRDGGPFDEGRTKLAPVARRKYSWNLRRDDCVGFLRTDVDDFLIQLRFLQYESFYLKDPRDAFRSGVSLGTGTGATVTFSLPSVGTESRDYPIDNANLVVYVSGSPVTVSSVDTDARTVTLASPPGNGLAVTADYDHYKLCRVDGEFTWTGQSSTSYDTAVSIVEVVA